MSISYYVLQKNKPTNGTINSENNIKGYKFKPKNSVQYNGVKVREMILVNHSMVQKVLMKKTQRKLEMFLRHIIELLDDDDSGTTDLKLALNELNKFKMLKKNTYRDYLEKEFATTMLKRIKILDQELKKKIILINLANTEEKEEVAEERIGRRR